MLSQSLTRKFTLIAVVKTRPRRLTGYIGVFPPQSSLTQMAGFRFYSLEMNSQNRK